MTLAPDSHRLLSTVPFIVDNFAEYSEKKDKANRQGEISILVEVISKVEARLIRSAAVWHRYTNFKKQRVDYQ